MNISPLEMTPLGDLLMWGGLGFLGMLGAMSLAAPRWLRKRRTQAITTSAR